MPSLIVTLGMFNVLNGISLLISDGSQQTTPTGPNFGEWFGVGDYHTFYWAFGLMLAMHFVLTMTPWGLHTIAVGGNRVGASESGVNVSWIRIGNFVMCSVLGGFAGILTAQHIGTTDPLQGGTNLMFYGVAGAVIGGTALMGGSGHGDRLVHRRRRAHRAQQRLHAARRRRVLQRPLHRHRDPALDGARIRDRARAEEARMSVAEPAAVQPDGAPDDVLRVEHVAKSFGAITALRDVSLHLRKGEVLGLIGDNGAGKSTLVKILSGYHRPDSGEISIFGEPVQLKSVIHARSLGIDTVYQDLALVPGLSVFHNMFLKREHTRFGVLDNGSMRALARAHLDSLGVNIPDVNAEVATLSGGQRQAIAVARSVFSDAKIILLDEPLAAMGAKEGGLILKLIRELRERGDVSQIVIAHNYLHVLETCDRVCLLQNGRITFDRPTAETSVAGAARRSSARSTALPRREPAAHGRAAATSEPQPAARGPRRARLPAAQGRGHQRPVRRRASAS